MTGTATVNVVTGRIEISGDLVEPVTGAVITGTTVEPWGVDETGMDRADAALADLGLARTSDWTRSQMQDEISTATVSIS